MEIDIHFPIIIFCFNREVFFSLSKQWPCIEHKYTPTHTNTDTREKIYISLTKFIILMSVFQ